MVAVGMPKWTEQEQHVICVVLGIFLVGIAGKVWLRSHPSQSPKVDAAVLIQSTQSSTAAATEP